MEVILIERMQNLGQIGDKVEVKNGYARNFLIPQGKVLRATNENKAEFESRKDDIEKQNAEKRSVAEKEAKKISDKFVTLTRQAGDDGRLYGSVSARDVAEIVSSLGVEISRGQISLKQPIKYLGVYPETVALHPEVIVTVNVNVARNEDEAAEAKKEFLNPTKKEEEFVYEEVTEAPEAEASEESPEQE